MAKSTSTSATAARRRKASVSGGVAREAVAPTWAQSGETLTTANGVPVDDTDNSLRVGERGPTLLDDFHLREKIMHFDHERIPERVVHARGAGAHGTFRLTTSVENLTSAAILSDTTVETPVFVRFSTVAGSRGSADTARDVRGFAVRFYTREGNWDLVGNNIPVFFIQDGIKFPDVIHAAKPEPDREIPQAQTAHDTFWDFASLTPESTHMLMWIMSDRSIPAFVSNDGGFRGPHLPAGERPWEDGAREVPLEAHRGIGLTRVGRSRKSWVVSIRIFTEGISGRLSRLERFRSGIWGFRSFPTTRIRHSKASISSTLRSWSPRR